ncbi:MAG: Gfo/Idh/MocA family oxidoreductase [Paracoccaceae bacterium]|nr:Gfo/Idh/MocA family oxidoreductase [Paracoccaceae bacterium]
MAMPLRAGFIGTGRISDLHAIAYLNDSPAKIVALCDQNTALARGRAEAWGLDDVFVTGDVDALLSRPDVDLVEILLPHHLHFPVAMKAIAAGKTVSLQKPMCTSLEEADRLVAAAAASGRPFRVFENFIFFPPIVRARQLLDAGAIGDPISIRIKSNSGTSRTAWDVPREAIRWRLERETSGGGPLVFDDGHHKFALAWHFMGNPESVHAYIGRTKVADSVVLDAPSIVSFLFPGNRIGSFEIVHSPELEIATRHYAQDDRVEITGTHGVIWVNCGHGRLGDTPPVVHYRDGRLIPHSDMPTGWEQSFVQATRHYFDCLANGQPAALSASDARQVLRFALAAEESGQTGKRVDVDLD